MALKSITSSHNPLKHVVLIMRIINIIINMDDIRQERSNKEPTLKLNKRFK